MKPTPRKLSLSLADLEVTSFVMPASKGQLRGTVRGLQEVEIPDPSVIFPGFPDSEICPKTLNPTECCGPTLMTGACCWV